MKSVGDLLAGVLSKVQSPGVTVGGGKRSGAAEQAVLPNLVAPTSERRPGVRRPAFDNDYLWRWLEGQPDRRRLMAVAAWLNKTGVKDASKVEAIIEEGVRCKVRNWYAHFRPGSEARRNVLLRFEREGSARFKQRSAETFGVELRDNGKRERRIRENWGRP